MLLCPKLQVNSLSWGCEDQEELVGTSLLPSVSNSRGTKPLEGGEEQAAALRTLAWLRLEDLEVLSNQNSMIFTHELSMPSSPPSLGSWAAQSMGTILLVSFRASLVSGEGLLICIWHRGRSLLKV